MDGEQRSDGESSRSRSAQAGQEGSPIRGKRRMKFVRSRGGCDSCRKQKKCDEVRPSCQRCKAVRRPCRYTDEPHSPSAFHSPSPEPSNHILHAAAPPLGPSNSSLSFGALAPLDGQADNLPIFPPPEPLPTLPLDNIFNAISNTAQTGPVVPQASQTAPADVDIDDAFLQAFFAADPFVPLPNHSPTQATSIPTVSSSVNTALPSATLFSVPVDCDSSLWASFVEASHWESRRVDGGLNGPLLEYFTKFASTTVVVRNGPNSASRFYLDLASRATQENQTALMHAVLCVSAQHLSNWAKQVGDSAKAVSFGDQSAQHKSQALHLLRVASTAEESDPEVAPAIMVMLTLSAILRGDAHIVPLFLIRTSSLLDRLQRPAAETFLPTVSAFHSLYSAFHLVSLGRQVETSRLFRSFDERAVWGERADEVCETVAGVRRNMLLLFLRVHSLVIELRTIAKALERNRGDDELVMMQMEIKSECSSVELDLAENETWSQKYLSDCANRTRVGHEFYRLAIRATLLSEVFERPLGHGTCAACVSDMLKTAQSCPSGMEIGLVWPYIIVACHAAQRDRAECTKFIRRCQWKGSAAPKIAEKVVEAVWSKRDKGETASWREEIAALGSPLII